MSSNQHMPTIIDTFAPWAGNEERALRLRIHRAQAVAVIRADRDPNPHARATYEIASDLALRWVFRRVDNLGDLERVILALAELFLAADNMTQVDAGHE